MTIPRVLLAAALLILGFMILGVEKSFIQLEKNVTRVSQEITDGKDMLAKQLTALNRSLTSDTKEHLSIEDKLDRASDTLDKLYKLTKGKGIISKPRVKPVPCVQRQHSVFDPWFQQNGSQSSHKTPQC